MRCSAGKMKKCFALDIHELLTSWQSCIHQLSEISQICGSSWRAASHKAGPHWRIWLAGSGCLAAYGSQATILHSSAAVKELFSRGALFFHQRSYLTGRTRSDNRWSLTKRKTLNLVTGAAQNLTERESLCPNWKTGLEFNTREHHHTLK